MDNDTKPPHVSTSVETDLLHFLRLSLLDGVGPVNARKLVAYCGGAEAVFAENKKGLCAIPGIGDKVAEVVLSQSTLDRAERELEWMRSEGVHAHSYLDADYPRRLTQCDDAPILLFYRGTPDLNPQRVLSIVGTRKATEYGRGFIHDFLREMRPYDPLILSGLAYGIDIIAHREALAHELRTVGVLAHGLDRVYPGAHRQTAHKMLERGGLISEFVSGTKPDRERFPMRNRVVAGMCDATIVVESAARGGSMITAYLANEYNRDVFAVPGRVGDEYSEGCNLLIRNDVAHLLDNVEEFVKLMGWQQEESAAAAQTALFVDLRPEQEQLMTLLSTEPKTVDLITIESQLPMSKVSPMLLELEFMGLVRTLPGKQYVRV